MPWAHSSALLAPVAGRSSQFSMGTPAVATLDIESLGHVTEVVRPHCLNLVPITMGRTPVVYPVPDHRSSGGLALASEF